MSKAGAPLKLKWTLAGPPSHHGPSIFGLLSPLAANNDPGMTLDKELKREIRVETGMSFGRTTPSSAEIKAAVRQMLESKLKQKRQALETSAKESLISDICDDLLGFGPVQ